MLYYRIVKKIECGLEVHVGYLMNEVGVCLARVQAWSQAGARTALQVEARKLKV